MSEKREDNIYVPIFQKTLLEFIDEITDILNSKRYEVPDIINTDLKMAKITISAAPPELVTDIMTLFGKFVIQFEKEIKTRDVDFFKRLDVCRACCNPKGSKKVTGKCICLHNCSKTCTCDGKCSNCSETLKDLDSKTLVAAKFIVEQAINDSDDDKREDIKVIFDYIGSLLAASKNYKKR